jgi:hypothetical protein
MKKNGDQVVETAVGGESGIPWQASIVVGLDHELRAGSRCYGAGLCRCVQTLRFADDRN